MRGLKNRNGVAGFFEDIPALIVVTIGVGIFLTSIVSTYPKYIESEQNADFMRESLGIAESVRASSELLYELDNQNGVFDAYKVQKIDSNTLNLTVGGGFSYRIDIVDVGDYTTRYNKTLQTFDADTSHFRMSNVITLPICIKKSESEVHPAKLIVALYKM